MRRYLLLLSLAGALALTGCFNDDTVPGAAASSGFSLFGSSEEESPTRYGVLLATVSGNDRVSQVKVVKQLAAPIADEDDIVVIHEATISRVYWGEDQDITDAEEKLKKAKTYRLPSGERPFAGAQVLALPGKDLGPEEYNLRHVDTSNYAWTVLVGEFYDMDRPELRYIGKRRRGAVKYCEYLREKGYDAYFYHGPVRSLVTVGLFPDKSMTMKTVGYRTNQRTGERIPVKAEAIADPRITKIMKTKDPHLWAKAVNGHYEYIPYKDKRTGELKRRIAGSKPIRIPGKK